MARALLFAVGSLSVACGGDYTSGGEESVSTEAINRGWRGWSPMPTNTNGFSGSAAVCSARVAVGNPLSDSSGYFALGLDATSNRYRSSVYEFFTEKTAWADFGSQTFATKATCASLDEMYQGPKV